MGERVRKNEDNSPPSRNPNPEAHPRYEENVLTATSQH